jgi:hypothetical protein
MNVPLWQHYEECRMIATLNFWLWIATIPLVALYSYAFVVKTFFSKERMIKMWGWPADFPLGFIRLIGLCEGAAVLGLLLPVLTGILPWMTAVTAVCLTVLQVCALSMHLKRHDNVALNLVLLVLSAFVAWGYRGLLGL